MQAFHGIRVLDFTHVYAGPFATFQLAVMGADVIKVEPPWQPDQMRAEGVDATLNEQGLGTNYIINNQGKRAITLDLAQEEGAHIARQLLESADVVVENYGGLLGRYGLDANSALELNPRLVYCELSGFGGDNPRAGRPAYDPVIQAASGMMSVNGEPGRDFLRVGPPLIDYGTGAQTAFAIASALYQRERDGRGRIIEVNMFDAALLMMSPQVANAIHAGQTDARSGNIPPSRPGYSVYACAEGDLLIGAFTVAHHRRLIDRLEPDLDPAPPQALTREWIVEQADPLRRAIAARLREKSADEWETLLNDADVPAARVRDLHEVLAQEQGERAASSRFERYPDRGITAPVAAFRFDADGPSLDPRCARHGEDSAAVLEELGYSSAEIETLAERGVI